MDFFPLEYSQIFFKKKLSKLLATDEYLSNLLFEMKATLALEL